MHLQYRCSMALSMAPASQETQINPYPCPSLFPLDFKPLFLLLPGGPIFVGDHPSCSSAWYISTGLTGQPIEYFPNFSFLFSFILCTLVNGPATSFPFQNIPWDSGPNLDLALDSALDLEVDLDLDVVSPSLLESLEESGVGSLVLPALPERFLLFTCCFGIGYNFLFSAGASSNVFYNMACNYIVWI